MTNYYNYNYVGEICIGSPPQCFNTIFDTGSTNFWCLSTHCNNGRAHNGVNNAFDPELSSSYEPTNTYCEVMFGSGGLKGFFAWDDVRVGARHKASNGEIHTVIDVKHQTFGMIVNECVLDESFDCITGLAYPTMSNTGSKKRTPLFDSMMQ